MTPNELMLFTVIPGVMLLGLLSIYFAKPVNKLQPIDNKKQLIKER